MKIEKYEKIGSSKYRLYLDNGEVIDTYDEVILKNDLLLKKELTTNSYATILIETNLVSSYNACLKYISIRLRSVKEIKDYLLRKKVVEEDIEEIVKRLLKNKLLDDNHFTECFIKDKLNFTSMGEHRIIAELKKNNISNDIIHQYSYLFNEETMLERIEKIVEKQIQTNHKLDKYKLRNKIYNYLLNQGYSSSNIVTILNQKF